jgi:C4-type Zn-finger protein
MEEQKVICPVCGGEVKEIVIIASERYIDETIEECVGTCEECGEIIEYERTYPRKNWKIEITDHYKD